MLRLPLTLPTSESEDVRVTEIPDWAVAGFPLASVSITTTES